MWEGGHCYEDQVLPTIPLTHHTIKPNTFLQEMEGEVAALYKQLEAAGADPRHTHRCSGDQQWDLNAFFNAAAQGRQRVGQKDIRCLIEGLSSVDADAAFFSRACIQPQTLNPPACSRRRG